MKLKTKERAAYIYFILENKTIGVGGEVSLSLSLALSYTYRGICILTSYSSVFVACVYNLIHHHVKVAVTSVTELRSCTEAIPNNIMSSHDNIKQNNVDE
jgi:hypothetical protein